MRKQRFADGKTEKAIDGYKSAMDSWAKAMEKFRALALMIDRGIGNEMLATIESYAAALAKDGQVVPPDYVLSQFFHLYVSHTAEVNEARRLAAQAGQHAGNSEYPQAQKLFEEAMKQWRGLLDRYPSILVGTDPIVAQQISETIAAYQKVLELRGKELPEDFPLKDFVEKTEKKA